MWVQATEPGFYGRSRTIGEKFVFTSRRKPDGYKKRWKGDQPGSWMEPCDPPDDHQPEAVADLYAAVKRDGEKWYDVVGSNDVPVNEKGMEEEDANNLADRLNGVEMNTEEETG